MSLRWVEVEYSGTRGRDVGTCPPYVRPLSFGVYHCGDPFLLLQFHKTKKPFYTGSLPYSLHVSLFLTKYDKFHDLLR